LPGSVQDNEKEDWNGRMRVHFHAKKKVIKVIFKLASYLNRIFYYKTEHLCYTNSFLIKACLVPKILRHIESLDTCMKH
jgi:hypothetical protein